MAKTDNLERKKRHAAVVKERSITRVKRHAIRRKRKAELRAERLKQAQSSGSQT